jgi:hypothetical protein
MLSQLYVCVSDFILVSQTLRQNLTHFADEPNCSCLINYVVISKRHVVSQTASLSDSVCSSIKVYVSAADFMKVSQATYGCLKQQMGVSYCR